MITIWSTSNLIDSLVNPALELFIVPDGVNRGIEGIDEHIHQGDRIRLLEQPLDHISPECLRCKAAIKSYDLTPARVGMLPGELLGPDAPEVAFQHRGGREVFLERQMGKREDFGTTLDQKPGAPPDVLKEMVGSSRLVKNLLKDLSDRVGLALSSVICLHGKCDFAADAQLLAEPELRVDATSLVPVMQQPLDTEPVQQASILRQSSSLEVVDEADRRKHERIARQIADVQILLESTDDPVSVLSSFMASLVLGLVSSQPDRGAPVPSELGDLRIIKILQFAFEKTEPFEGALA